ncbi:MAG: late competence development ComFB family protein [Spirochaetales bacterium]|nr:late competence development ComFB family protein [Spirochaetales bacterium]
MGIRDDYDFENLENAAEKLVFDELEKQLKENPPACTCQECILDIAALALNHVKPYYRVSLLGKLYANSAHMTTYGEEVKKAVQDAIGKISGNPSHD